MKTIDELHKENAYISNRLSNAYITGKLFMDKDEYDHFSSEAQKMVDNSSMIEVINPTYVESTVGATAAEIIQESINPDKVLTTGTDTVLTTTTSNKFTLKHEPINSEPAQDGLSSSQSMFTQNIFEGRSSDGFICKECGLHLEDWVEIKIVDDEEKPYEFEMRVCPNCGRHVLKKR